MRSSFEPQWDGVFRNYTESFVRKQLWRIARTCDHDDAMQEARLVYLDCVMRYSERVDNAAWFMSLYQRALFTHFTDLANADTKHKEAALMCDVVPEDAPALDQVGDLANEGELRTMVRQASSEIKAVLALMINAPVEIMDLVSAQWRSHGGGQAYGSKMLCRMLGLPEDVGLLQRVREYFEPEG